MTIKDVSYVTTNSVNLSNPIINKINEYIEKSKWNEYMTLYPPYENKDRLDKYEEFKSKIRDLIRSITSN